MNPGPVGCHSLPMFHYCKQPTRSKLCADPDDSSGADSVEEEAAAPQLEGRKIRLTVQLDGEKQLKASMLTTEPFSKLEAWLQKQWEGQPGSKLQLVFDGELLSATGTPLDVELEDEDIIDASFK